MIKKIVIAAGVIAILIAVAGYFIYNKPHRTVDEADISVDASTLVTAFDENEEEANSQYLDKVVEVRGKVKEVIRQDESFVVLLGDDSSFNSVSCTLDHQQDSVAYGLKPGDEVVVRGICTGFLLDVVLVKCKILNEAG